MFEKEAEEYTENPKSAWKQGMTCVGSVRQAFKDGAEFGYNKANEWHYVKDGDLPKDKSCLDCKHLHTDLQLTNAKEIIRELLSSCFGYNSKTVNYEVKAKAEAFLKE